MTADLRPIYVRQLDADRLAAQAERDALLAGMHELRRYLNSPKFRGERGPLRDYVNVDDVLLRMNETVSAATLAGDIARHGGIDL
jgi:hypothetical protein